MRKFLWLNPVVSEKYGGEELERQLQEKGYELVTCQEDHITAVKKKYQTAFDRTQARLGDARCPLAVDYIKETYNPAFLEFPDIEPILMHCARELHERLSQEGNLWIITPCSALADMGERIGLEGTRFYPWNEFARLENIPLCGRTLKESPIPPGFFAEYKEQVVLDSKEKIDDYFSAGNQPEEKKILELLYCTCGCHNGDGV